MSASYLEQIRFAIDQAVPPQGGPPKVQGPALNAVLHGLAEGLAPGAAPRVYEEILHFPGQPLYQDTVFEPSVLRVLTASAGVQQLELAVGTADFITLLAAPATTVVLDPPLALPVGPLTYRLTFAAGADYAAIKQIIEIQ
jgi:hypothetical protein